MTNTKNEVTPFKNERNIKMKTTKYFRLFAWSFILAVCLGMIGSNAQSAWQDNAEWADDYYQYRIPIEITVTSTGLQQLAIGADTPTVAGTHRGRSSAKARRRKPLR